MPPRVGPHDDRPGRAADAPEGSEAGEYAPEEITTTRLIYAQQSTVDNAGPNSVILGSAARGKNKKRNASTSLSHQTPVHKTGETVCVSALWRVPDICLNSSIPLCAGHLTHTQ